MSYNVWVCVEEVSLVLELVCKDIVIDGEVSKVFSMRDLLEEMEGSLPWDVRLKAAGDIANGMNFIHSNSLVHGDLKSSNVLVGGKSNLEWIFKVYKESNNYKSNNNNTICPQY